MLGFARKAGALVCGSFAVEQSLRKRKVLLVVADEALSARAQEELERLCKVHRIPFLLVGPPQRLGAAIGKQSKVVGVMEQAFSKRLQEIFLQAQRRGGVTV